MKTQITILMSFLILTSTTHAAALLFKDAEGFVSKEAFSKMSPEAKSQLQEFMPTINGKNVIKLEDSVRVYQRNPTKTGGTMSAFEVNPENGSTSHVSFEVAKTEPAQTTWIAQDDIKLISSEGEVSYATYAVYRNFKRDEYGLPGTSETYFIGELNGTKIRRTARAAFADGFFSGEVKLASENDGGPLRTRAGVLEFRWDHQDNVPSWLSTMTGRVVIPNRFPGEILHFELNPRGDKLKVVTGEGWELEYEVLYNTDSRRVTATLLNHRKLANLNFLKASVKPFPGRTSVGAPDAFDGLKKRAVGVQ